MQGHSGGVSDPGGENKPEGKRQGLDLAVHEAMNRKKRQSGDAESLPKEISPSESSVVTAGNITPVTQPTTPGTSHATTPVATSPVPTQKPSWPPIMESVAESSKDELSSKTSGFKPPKRFSSAPNLLPRRGASEDAPKACGRVSSSDDDEEDCTGAVIAHIDTLFEEDDDVKKEKLVRRSSMPVQQLTRQNVGAMPKVVNESPLSCLSWAISSDGENDRDPTPTTEKKHNFAFSVSPFSSRQNTMDCPLSNFTDSIADVSGGRDRSLEGVNFEEDRTFSRHNSTNFMSPEKKDSVLKPIGVKQEKSYTLPLEGMEAMGLPNTISRVEAVLNDDDDEFQPPVGIIGLPGPPERSGPIKEDDDIAVSPVHVDTPPPKGKEAMPSPEQQLRRSESVSSDRSISRRLSMSLTVDTQEASSSARIRIGQSVEALGLRLAKNISPIEGGSPTQSPQQPQAPQAHLPPRSPVEPLNQMKIVSSSSCHATPERASPQDWMPRNSNSSSGSEPYSASMFANSETSGIFVREKSSAGLSPPQSPVAQNDDQNPYGMLFGNLGMQGMAAKTQQRMHYNPAASSNDFIKEAAPKPRRAATDTGASSQKVNQGTAQQKNPMLQRSSTFSALLRNGNQGNPGSGNDMALPLNMNNFQGAAGGFFNSRNGGASLTSNQLREAQRNLMFGGPGAHPPQYGGVPSNPAPSTTNVYGENCDTPSTEFNSISFGNPDWTSTTSSPNASMPPTPKSQYHNQQQVFNMSRNSSRRSSLNSDDKGSRRGSLNDAYGPNMYQGKPNALPPSAVAAAAAAKLQQQFVTTTQREDSVDSVLEGTEEIQEKFRARMSLGSQRSTPSSPLMMQHAPAKTPTPSQITCLDDVKGHVLSLAKDQGGCRALQNLIDGPNSELNARAMLLEIHESILTVLSDPFGNYLFQKIFKNVSASMQLHILKRIHPIIVSTAMDLHGTRSIQLIVETIDFDEEQYKVIREATQNSIKELSMDHHGNHVIQRMLIKLGKSRRGKFITDVIIEHFEELCSHVYGCVVVKKALKLVDNVVLSTLLGLITTSARDLVQDRYGNYVIQEAIKVAPKRVQVFVIAQELQGMFPHLSLQKYSSNAVELLLDPPKPNGFLDDLDVKIVQQVIFEIVSPEVFPRIAMDKFGNFVVQKSVSIASGHSLEMLLHALEPLWPALRNAPHGKHIAATVNKKMQQVHDQVPHHGGMGQQPRQAPMMQQPLGGPVDRSFNAPGMAAGNPEPPQVSEAMQPGQMPYPQQYQPYQHMFNSFAPTGMMGPYAQNMWGEPYNHPPQ